MTAYDVCTVQSLENNRSLRNLNFFRALYLPLGRSLLVIWLFADAFYVGTTSVFS